MFRCSNVAFVIALIAFCWMVSVPIKQAVAQDSVAAANTAESAPQNSTEKFEQAKKAMREHLVKLRETMIRYHLSEDEQLDNEMRDLWWQQLIEGRAIAYELQHQLVAAAKQATGEKQKSLNSLIFSLFAENSNLDRYEKNWELAQHLIDVGYEDAKKEIYVQIGRNALALSDLATARQYFEKAAAADAFSDDEKRVAMVLPDAEKKWPLEVEARKKDEQKGDLPRVEFSTTKGKFVMELFEDEAPETVGNFISLIEKEFYNDLLFHRVEKHLVAQTGCPNGDGTGGPGYSIKGESGRPNGRNHFRGAVGMALVGDKADSGGSQFYICLCPLLFLDGKFTVFGRIVEGMDVVEHLNRVNESEKKEDQELKLVPDKILNAKVIRKRPHEYRPVYSEPPKQ